MLNLFLLLVSLASPAPAFAAKCENGIYETGKIVEGTKTESDFTQLTKKWGSANVRYVYITSKALLKDPAVTEPFLRKIKEKQPNVQLIGYLVGRPCMNAPTDKPTCFGYSNPEVVGPFEEKVAQLWKLGVDGIQLDFEPMPENDQGFLDLIAKLKAKKPAKGIISVAGFFLPLNGKAKDEIRFQPETQGPMLFWSKEYYERVLSAADHVMAMLYDTAIRSSEEYSKFMEFQTRELSALAARSNAKVQIGVPSNKMVGRRGLYDRKFENLTNGISGVKAAFQHSDCPKGVGVTVYEEEGMDNTQWVEFSKAFGK